MKIYQVIEQTNGTFSKHSSFSFFIEKETDVTQWIFRDKKAVGDREWVIREYLSCLNKIYHKD